jgi:predicted small secreted protein
MHLGPEELAALAKLLLAAAALVTACRKRPGKGRDAAE